MKLMRYFGLAILAALLGLGSSISIGGSAFAQAQVCTVTVQPGESIQRAIDQAKEGDVICLVEGTWEENLVIGKSLTLRAAEIKPEPAVVIRSAKEGWPVILIRSEEPIEVTIIGLEITGAFGECHREPEWICADGISVHGRAKATIQKNTVSGHGGCGISMWDSSQATIRENTISGNGWHGILMSNSSQATIQGNTISGSRWYGIKMAGFSRATIENNTISGNRDHGISMWVSSQATIQNNTISGNKGYGIRIGDFSQATIQGNTISGSRWHGIKIEGFSQATIQNNTISGNEQYGILMRGSSQATVQNNTISGNWDGILMEDSSQAAILKNTISGNKGGISMWGSSQVTIQNNTISGNERHGIRIGGFSQATIWNNSIQDNCMCGIFSSSANPARGGGNHMEGNGADLCGNLSAALRVPLVPETAQKELTFPGPYDSLQKTIDALAPGGTILMGAGEYQSGLTIWKPLTLKGAGRDRTTVKGAISLIEEAQGVMIEGMAITSSPFVGIILGSLAKATIQNNTISGNQDDGISMWGSSQATIRGNTISGNGWHGIRMWDSSQATIQNNTISGNWGGIMMLGSSQATILENTISDNEEDGIMMLGSPQAIIKNNKIVNNGGYGVMCWERPCFDTDTKFKGTVLGSGNKISRNKKADVCPKDLGFLKTRRGGCYGPKCISNGAWGQVLPCNPAHAASD